MANRPAPEIEIDEALVRSLLRDQHGELATLPLQMLSRGWDNTNFRLGAEHLVRVPHRAVAAQLILHEQTWLPSIAAGVDLAVPAPTHAGAPTDFFPWPWSITRFIAGQEAASAALKDSAATAEVLGRFFAQLHQPAPVDSPPNPFRGCALSARREPFYANASKLDDRLDTATISAVTAIFDQACAVDESDEHVWLHGDLHTRTMIMRDGELVAVVDWGDICAGDRATDLAAAFMLVPNDLATVRRHAGASTADWQRAQGWAANFAVIYVAHSDDDPVMGDIGTRLIAALLRN